MCWRQEPELGQSRAGTGPASAAIWEDKGLLGLLAKSMNNHVESRSRPVPLGEKNRRPVPPKGISIISCWVAPFYKWCRMQWSKMH